MASFLNSLEGFKGAVRRLPQGLVTAVLSFCLPHVGLGCSGKTDIPDVSKRPRGGHGQKLGNPGAVFSFPAWETPLEVQPHDSHEHSRRFGTCPETWQDRPGWPWKSSLSQLSLTSIFRPPPLSSLLLLFHAQNSCSRWTQLASVWDVSQHLVMCSWISGPLCGVSHWLWLDPCRMWAPSSWVHKPKSIIWKQTPRSLRQGPDGTTLHWDTASWPCLPRILLFSFFFHTDCFSDFLSQGMGIKAPSHWVFFPPSSLLLLNVC